MGAHSKAPRLRRVRSMITVGVMVAAGLVWAASPSQAAVSCSPPGGLIGGFEIDGNTATHDCSPTGDDWAAHQLRPTGDVSGTSTTGTYKPKDDNSATSTWSDGGGTPPKSDFVQVYSFAKVVGSEYFAYVAWERDQTSGSGGYAIEIDNSAATYSTSSPKVPAPDRSQGGVVVYYDMNGGNLPVFAGACAFTSQANYPTEQSQCIKSPQTSGFASAVSSALVQDPFTNSGVAAGGFYEIGLNLTALTGIHPSCPSVNAATMYMRSMTGNVGGGVGPNNNIKGWVSPLTLQPPSTCVTPTVTTADQPGNITQNGVTGVPQGTEQYDVATVTGTNSIPAPSGSVKFFLCSGSGITGCPSGGTQIGSSVTLTKHASNSTAQSDKVNTLANKLTPGTYCWRAEYTPDVTNDNNPFLSSVETDFTNECFTVVHKSPTITTDIQVTMPDGGITGSLGLTQLADKATLSGYAGSVQGETVSFSLWGPYATLADATCTGTPFFTTTGTLDANGVATTASSTTPSASAGVYVWTATYDAAANHNPWNDSATDACGEQTEQQDINAAVVKVVKDASSASVSAGDVIGFDIKVQNTSSVTATNVTITDHLPTGPGNDLVWTLGNGADPACSLDSPTAPQTLTCHWSQLAPSQTATTVAHVSATTTRQDCGTVSNTATITAGNDEGTPDPSTASITVNCPALTIEKTADAASVSVGSPIGFTVTVKNSGPGDAYGVVLSDPLPTGPGITWTIDGANTSGPLTCDDPIVGSTLHCTGTLAAGQSEIVHVTSPTQWTGTGEAEVNSCLGGPQHDGVYDNTATVTATNSGVVDPASATETVYCPDLTITKTADVGSVNAKTSIGFTIEMKNTGKGDATNVVLTDDLSKVAGGGIVWTIDAANTSGPLSCDISVAGVLTCTGTLPSNGTESVHIVSPTTFASCGTYDNTAGFTAGNDPHSGTASDSVTVHCAALQIQKTAVYGTSEDPTVGSVDVGSNIGFDVTIKNTGDGTAFGVNVSDDLTKVSGPGIDWKIDNAHTSGPLTCGISSGVLTCTGDMAPSATQVVRIVSTTQWTGSGENEINSCGTYDNRASVQWDNGPADAYSSNLATETVLCPNIDVTKTADASPVSAGDGIGFTITVTNSGEGTATGVTLDDPLKPAAGVTWDEPTVTGAPEGASCTITDGTLHCDLGDLAGGAVVTIRIVGATTPAACSANVNTATIAATNEPNTPHSDAPIDVLCPNTTVSKVTDDGTHDQLVNDGDAMGFTITVTNADTETTGTAHDAALSDPLPAGPAGSDALWVIGPAYDGPGTCEITGDQGSQVLNCHFGDLKPGASASVHLTSNTSFATCGDYPNTADLIVANDTGKSDSATNTVVCPVLDSIVVKADAASVKAGRNIGFTLSGQNKAVHVTVDQPVEVAARTAASTRGAGAAFASSLVEPGTVVNAVLVSALPAGAGVNWSISPAYTGPGTCAIAGPVGAQILTCELGDLAPQESFKVHILSDTKDCSNVGPLTDKGTLSAANVPDVSSQDTTKALGFCAEQAQNPPKKHTQPVAVTGVPLLGIEIGWGIAFLLFGGVLLIAARRRNEGIE